MEYYFNILGTQFKGPLEVMGRPRTRLQDPYPGQNSYVVWTVSVWSHCTRKGRCVVVYDSSASSRGMHSDWRGNIIPNQKDERTTRHRESTPVVGTTG